MPTIRREQTVNFTQLPNTVLMDATLSVTARLVWSVGMTHVHNWIFHQGDLAKKCGVSVNTLKNALDELRGRGFVYGAFRSENAPLTFSDSADCENQNCQNLIVDDSGNCQNLIANNTKNNTKNNIPESELVGSAFNVSAAKTETEALTLTFSADQDFEDIEPPPQNSPPQNSPQQLSPQQNSVDEVHRFAESEAHRFAEDEVHRFAESEWRGLVDQWNAAGLPRYTALAPSSLDVMNFCSLLRRYGRDGPRLLCERSSQSEWIKTQRWSLSLSLREDLATKIIDGQYAQTFKRKVSQDDSHLKLPCKADYAKGFFHDICPNGGD